jgi:pimeloyl-ACP methyl ester carboxylesterase
MPDLSTETSAPLELARLLADPVYRGAGVPRGDGRHVLVLPGLLGNDLYLVPLHTWLLRIGYRPVISRILFNAGCPQRMTETVARSVDASIPPGTPFAIIGHSRGGMLGWAIAAHHAERVTDLILLGSPAPAIAAVARRGMWGSATAAANERVVRTSDLFRRMMTPDCTVPACGCPYVGALGSLLDVRTKITSIFSMEDPVVPAEASMAPGATNIRVSGSHSGLANNAEVYRAIASALAR